MHLFWLLIPAIYTYICVLGTLCTSEMLWRDHQHRLCCISSPWFTMVPIPLLVLLIDVQLLFVWREFNRLFWRCHKSNGKYIFSSNMFIFFKYVYFLDWESNPQPVVFTVICFYPCIITGLNSINFIRI